MTRFARGRITLVQEQRFRLATDDGPNYLLILAHDAPLDEAGLVSLKDSRAHVVVEYSGEPGLDSGIAHALRPTSP